VYKLELEEMSRDQLLQQLIHGKDVQFGKHSGSKRNRRTSGIDINELNWRKKNIFFKIALLVNIETTTQFKCYAY
jgi:hypothetical protein